MHLADPAFAEVQSNIIVCARFDLVTCLEELCLVTHTELDRAAHAEGLLQALCLRLAVSRRSDSERSSPISDHFGRNPTSDHVIGERFDNNSTRADDRVPADVSHNDCSASDPATLAYANEGAHTRLFANRNVRVCDSVEVRSARDVDARGEQDVLFEVTEAKMTAGPYVGVLVDPSTGLREDSPEFDTRVLVAVRQGETQKTPTQVLSGKSRGTGEQMGCPFEGPVLTHQKRRQGVRA